MNSRMEVLKTRADYTKAMLPDGVAVLHGMTKYCPECRMIAPELEQLMRKYPDARFYCYDLDDSEDIAHELGANFTPTFAVFKDGMVQDGVTGPRVPVVEEMIKEIYEGRVMA